MKTSQKKKCYHFFCYEGAVEGKNLRKSVKNQDFRLETFFVKGSKMEKIATSAELKTEDQEFYFRCVYILFILAEYLPRIHVLCIHLF